MLGGSSPLARGTYALRGVLLKFVRLIPARAGNIFWSDRILSPPAAHPRSRGEHWTDITAGRRHRGSSPLARGT